MARARSPAPGPHGLPLPPAASAGTGVLSRQAQVGKHLSLSPVLRLPQLQLALKTEHAVRCLGQLLGQPVVGLLHVLQLSPQKGIHLGEAGAPGWVEMAAA